MEEKLRIWLKQDKKSDAKTSVKIISRLLQNHTQKDRSFLVKTLLHIFYFRLLTAVLKQLLVN